MVNIHCIFLVILFPKDSVRQLAVEACCTIASQMKNDEAEKYLMVMLREAANDKSWRVRYVVADKIVDVSLVVMPSAI